MKRVILAMCLVLLGLGLVPLIYEASISSYTSQVLLVRGPGDTEPGIPPQSPSPRG